MNTTDKNHAEIAALVGSADKINVTIIESMRRIKYENLQIVGNFSEEQDAMMLRLQNSLREDDEAFRKQISEIGHSMGDLFDKVSASFASYDKKIVEISDHQTKFLDAQFIKADEEMPF